MAESTSRERWIRYQCVLKEGRRDSDDWEWLKETLARHPELARERLPDGELPLRVLLRRQAKAGLFGLLEEHGAEHDIITASAATDLAAAERLLRAEPEVVHQTDEVGNTPLHWACVRYGYQKPSSDTIGLLRRLVAAGGHVNAENRFEETPLDLLLLKGDWNACSTLLDHGACPGVLYGVASEDFELLDDLLEDTPDKVHWRDPRTGECLYHLAVEWESDPAMFEYLYARGAHAELESRAGRANRTPLLLALDTENIEGAEALVRLGADVNAKESRANSSLPNSSVLGLAVACDRLGLTEMLIDRGANLHERDRSGGTLLCRVESSEMAELLILAGLDPTTGDSNGWSPMDYAIEEGRRDVIATLARRGVEPGFFASVVQGDCCRVREMLTNNPGLISSWMRPAGEAPAPKRETGAIEVPWGSICGTALHYAAKGGVLDMVKTLLNHGADVNAATDPEGWTPLHDAVYYAIDRDLREGTSIIRTLVKAGADLNATTWGGYSPLDIAEHLGFLDNSAEIIDLLSELQRGNESDDHSK